MAQPFVVDVDGARGVVAEHPSQVGCGYDRHRPEKTVLWRTSQAHWKTFLAELESVADPRVLPAFVVSEVEAFLRCGILAHGLVLVRCGHCGRSRAVAFSCQRRGFCPSCIGRRMCDFSARLVTDVLPRVPVIGVIEVAAALALLYPRTASYGALAGATVMLGGMFTHVRAGEASAVWHEAVLLALCLLLLATRWRRRLRPGA